MSHGRSNGRWIREETAGRRGSWVMQGLQATISLLTFILRSHYRRVMCQITVFKTISLASFLRSFHKGSRAEAGGIVRLLLLDSWSEMIVAWFTAVSGEMMRNGWILDIF